MFEKGSDWFNIRLIIGILIIAFGLIILLQNFDFDIPFYIWDFWPLVLIIIGLSQIARPKEYRNVSLAVILIVVGLLFQLGRLDIIRFGIRELWPVLLILIGLVILKQSIWRSSKGPSGEDYINLSTILGGGEFHFTSKQIKGGSITAIMGGATVNLREADFPDEVVTIDTFTLMGGIEIVVPPNWQVNMGGVPILGGMENKTSLAKSDDPDMVVRKLNVKGMAIMGGVEVKN